MALLVKKKKSQPPTCLLTLHSKRIADTIYAQCIRLSGFGPCSFTENASLVLTPVFGDLHAEPGSSSQRCHFTCSVFPVLKFRIFAFFEFNVTGLLRWDLLCEDESNSVA